MPSGAKKGKNAKKKKEKGPNNNISAIHSLVGDDDLKVHDEKETDGEVSSAVSQDHHYHQHQFTKGEEEELDKREDTKTVRSVIAGTESLVRSNDNEETQKAVTVENNAIQIDWKLDTEDDSDSKNLSIEYVKESHGGRMSLDSGSSSSSSSSGNSSDDESLVLEKNEVVKESKESKVNAANLITEAGLPEVNKVIQIDWELKPGDDSDSQNSSIGYVESLNELHGRGQLNRGNSSSSSSSDDESKNMVVKEPVKSKVDALSLFAGAGLPEAKQVTDGGPVMEVCYAKEPKEEGCDPLAANAPPINLVKPLDLPEVTQVIDGVPTIEAYSLVVKTVPTVDSENASKQVIPVNESLNATSSDAFGLGLKENGKNEGSGVQPVVMDMVAQLHEDEVAPSNDENSAISSCVVGFATQEDGDKRLPSPGIPTGGSSNDGAEHMKDSVLSECCDSHPLVASAQQPVQTTFWNGCCGLFEVFTGSNG